MSERRACRVINADRKSVRYRSVRDDDAGLREKLRDVPLDDRDTWSTLARQTAGAFAAWSNAVEDAPGDLAALLAQASGRNKTHHETHTRPTPQAPPR